jgi:hypothetical protein
MNQILFPHSDAINTGVVNPEALNPERYQLGEFIGGGGSRYVYEYLNNPGKVIGIEEYHTHDAFMSAWLHSANILHGFYPENFPEYFEVHSPTGHRSYEIIEHIKPDGTTCDFEAEVQRTLERMACIGLIEPYLDDVEENFVYRGNTLVHVDRIYPLNLFISYSHTEKYRGYEEEVAVLTDYPTWHPLYNKNIPKYIFNEPQLLSAISTLDIVKQTKVTEYYRQYTKAASQLHVGMELMRRRIITAKA